jgi:hypothetical protein
MAIVLVLALAVLLSLRRRNLRIVEAVDFTPVLLVNLTGIE